MPLPDVLLCNLFQDAWCQDRIGRPAPCEFSFSLFFWTTGWYLFHFFLPNSKAVKGSTQDIFDEILACALSKWFARPVRSFERGWQLADSCVRLQQWYQLSPVHSFRHSCAVSMLASGYPISDIKNRLGHRSIDSTMDYLQIDLSRKRDIQKKFIEYTQSKIKQDKKIEELIDWENTEETLAWLDSLWTIGTTCARHGEFRKWVKYYVTSFFKYF